MRIVIRIPQSAILIPQSMERAIGFEPMLTALQAVAVGRLATPAKWYTRKDSNLHFPASKTGSFADLATRAEIWSERQDLNLRTLVSKTSPCSHLRNALIENWLREKDSNLYLLVQSQPSYRLDDPEKFCLVGKAGLEPASFSLKN